MLTSDTTDVKIQDKQSRHLTGKLISNLLKNESNHIACLNKECVQVSTMHLKWMVTEKTLTKTC